MDTEPIIESTTKIISWFSDYGALQVMAAGFIICVVRDWMIGVWIIKKYGFVISELVTLLRELRKERKNGTA